MNIAKNIKYFFILPFALSVAAVAAIAVWGLKPGIDLAGGSLLEVQYQQTLQVQQVKETMQSLGLREVRIQPTDANGFIIRTRALSEGEHAMLFQKLQTIGQGKELQFTSIGPSLGAELMRKAWIAITLVIVLIIAFIAFAFRHVSKPVASWKYGIVAIITLLHDILIPVGLFAVLGRFAGAEVDALFIVALLTILGISINDTIVVFDRIRENLRRNEESRKREEFEGVVGRSIIQTITRSINTSLTVIIVLFSLYFLGPQSTKNFALTLIVGMIAGTYSSIFLASPLLVVWEKWSRKNK